MNEFKLARIRAGLSQAQLAEKIGCHRQTVSLVERGVQDPRHERAKAWLAACSGELDPRATVVLWLHPSRQDRLVMRSGRAVAIGTGLAEPAEDARAVSRERIEVSPAHDSVG